MSITIEAPIRTHSFRFVRETEHSRAWGETKRYQRREARRRRAEFLTGATARLLEVRQVKHGRARGLVAYVVGRGWRRIFAEDKVALAERLRRHGIEFDSQLI
jgi:hypothetical protein